MTRRSIIYVAGGLLAILGLAAWTHAGGTTVRGDDALAATQAGQVSVTGDAEVRVVPDEVLITLGVETWDKDLQLAKRQNDAVVKEVLEVAGDHGLEPQHVQTGYVSIEPRYRNGYYEERDFIGYFVHRTVVITLRDLSRFEALLADALDSGVNYVHGIEFRTTELRQHKDKARALAVQAAQEKAEALAGQLGQSVGEPQLIREEQTDWRSGYGAWRGAGMAQNVVQEMASGGFSGEGSLAPGLISISARVAVTFGFTG
jgi:uncharacterized protein YggE